METITVCATVAAEVQKAWDCFTMPEHITKWNFASDDWHCPKASNDLRVGGKYFGRMEAKDGSFGFDIVAIYDKVENLKHIEYTLEDGRKAKIIFVTNGKETTVTIDFDAEAFNPVEMQKMGWQAIMNNFKKHTETV